jgi:hypothetical protein
MIGARLAGTERDFRQLLLKAATLALAAALLFKELSLPAAALDPSWMLALQYGFLEQVDFGRYLIIAYGPLSFLTSGLFHPHTFHATILFQILGMALVFWPILGLRWSGITVGLLALCVLSQKIAYLNEGIVFAAVFSAFLLGLSSARLPAALSAAVVAVLSLSKLSFLFAAAPLFLLADAYRLWKYRSIPFQTAILAGGLVASFAASGQKLASVPMFLRNGWEISKGYSHAMSLPVEAADLIVLIPFVMLAVGLAGLLLWRMRHSSEPLRLLVTAAGLAWLTLVAYKASSVRPDPQHLTIGWNALLLITPVTLMWARASMRTASAHRDADVISVALVCGAFLWITTGGRMPSGTEIVGAKLANAAALVTWLNPGKAQDFERQRQERLREIAVRGLRIGRETIDVYPFEVSRVIAAGLNYQPRPMLQSYLAYSPELQRLELAHWRSPQAPAYLLFQLADIDRRLPTLALGPSIVELRSRYDVVANTGPLLLMRKRAQPRPVKWHTADSQALVLDQWLPMQDAAGKLTLAAIDIEPSLLGQLLALVDRPPVLTIELKLTQGEIRRYRYIPSMGKLGFAVSPDPARLFTTQAAGPAASVQAMRISGGALARSAFKPGSISFLVVEIL